MTKTIQKAIEEYTNDLVRELIGELKPDGRVSAFDGKIRPTGNFIFPKNKYNHYKRLSGSHRKWLKKDKERLQKLIKEIMEISNVQ